MKKIKILFILPSTDMGGAERQSIVLAYNLSTKDNIDVSFLCFENGNGDKAVCCLLETYKIKYKIIKSYNPDKRGIIGRLLRLFLLLKHLLRSNYDVIMPYMYEMNLYIGIIRKFINAKVCVWNQRDEGFNGKSTLANRLSLKNYDLFISNSNGGALFLINKLYVDREKVHIIENGIMPLKIKLNRNDWRCINEYQENEVLSCMLANIHRDKDHKTIIKAWKLVTNEIPTAKLLLVGKKGDTFEELNKYVEEIGLTNSIKFTGRVNDIGSLLNAVDISILSSKSEGTSNAVLESMSMSLPFIGTNIPGIRDIVGNNMIKYLFLPNDYIKAAELIIDFIKHKDLRNSAGLENKQTITTKYSIEKLGENTLNVLNAELKKKV